MAEARKGLKTAQVNLRIDPAMKRAAEKAAKADHRSLASLIEKLLADHIEGTTGKQPARSYRRPLGDWGEGHACRLLAKAKFTDIVPLNVDRQHQGGDVLATKDGRRYFFSVKARDRFGQNGKPNPSYNVYPEKVIKAAQAYGAIPAWLVIRADRRDNTFCSYWGLIDEIPPGRLNRNCVSVSMSEDAIREYCRLGRCLASNVSDPSIKEVFRGKHY
jgi:hypothetical protein